MSKARILKKLHGKFLEDLFMDDSLRDQFIELKVGDVMVVRRDVREFDRSFRRPYTLEYFASAVSRDVAEEGYCVTVLVQATQYPSVNNVAYFFGGPAFALQDGEDAD